MAVDAAAAKFDAVTVDSSQLPELPRGGLFLRIADWTSAAMGRPTNILVWLLLVVIWTCLFAFGGHRLATGTWLPTWFTSQGFNFPLNLITTVAELFIGFLVAAASNRSERQLQMTLVAIQRQEDAIARTEDALRTEIQSNIKLTTEVHELSQAIHDHLGLRGTKTT